METKITLNIESDLAQTVKSYAKKKGYTLSSLVENYFLALIKIEEKTTETTMNAPIANALFGSLNASVAKDKQKAVDAFLNFASKNRNIEKDFKFNREDCYDR